MTKLQHFALLLILALITVSYFTVTSKNKIISVFHNAKTFKKECITSNTGKIAKVIDATSVSIQNAQNLTSTGHIATHKSIDTVIQNKHTITTPTSPTKGRILVTQYGEQQVGAAISMFSLQKWAKTVGASVVEPFVQNSTFTLPIITSQQQLADCLQFRNYFNIDIWNNISIAKNVTPLISWDSFVSEVPKKFIFVIILKKLCKEERPIYADSEIVQQPICNNTFASFMKNYDFYINHLLKIKLVRKVCLSFYKTVLDIDNFTNIIYGNYKSSDTVVWFYLWKGFTKTNRARVFQPYFYRSPEILNSKMLHTSKKISDDGENYIRKVLRSEPGKYTAISIRTVLRAKHTPSVDHMSFFHNCIDKVGRIINHMNITDHVIFLSMDLGRFGDMAAKSYMSKELISYIKLKVFQSVYNNSLTMEQWEQSFI